MDVQNRVKRISLQSAIFIQLPLNKNIASMYLASESHWAEIMAQEKGKKCLINKNISAIQSNKNMVS